MQTWPVQDAKARFSEMLDTSLAEGPQVVTRHGKATAVLVPIRQGFVRFWNACAWGLLVINKFLPAHRADRSRSNRCCPSRLLLASVGTGQ